jgi:hypothetical protein
LKVSPLSSPPSSLSRATRGAARPFQLIVIPDGGSRVVGAARVSLVVSGAAVLHSSHRRSEPSRGRSPALSSLELPAAYRAEVSSPPPVRGTSAPSTAAEKGDVPTALITKASAQACTKWRYRLSSNDRSPPPIPWLERTVAHAGKVTLTAASIIPALHSLFEQSKARSDEPAQHVHFEFLPLAEQPDNRPGRK